LADGVAVLAPDGAVVWANEAMAHLLNRPLDELVGANGFALVHPDDLARAVDGLDYSQQFPGRTAVAPFRISVAGRDGWLDVEVKTGVLTRDGVEHIAVVIRDASARRAVHRALGSVAAGRPLEATIQLVADAVSARWADTGVAVVLPDQDGEHHVHPTGLHGALVEHAAGHHRGAGGAAPWELAAVADPIVVLGLDDVPVAVADAAREQGYSGCGLAPVRVGSVGDGCLIVWFDHVVIARLEFFHAAAELTEVLAVATASDLLHRELWNAARHDALTRLLNRFGFTQAFETCVLDARDGRTEVAATYYVDLDGLKAVNDLQGHAAGDLVLVELGGRLRRFAGERGIAARLGGDEFVVVRHVPSATAAVDAAADADRLVQTLALRRTPPISASVGVVVDDGVSAPAVLLERADAAMYRAKVGGGNRWST
jgi:diguanylate cyclase (GGDEF)-like protein